MARELPVHIGDHAIDELTRFCRERQLRHLMLVADQNTYPVLGERVEQMMVAAGCDVRKVILTGAEVTPDEFYIMQVLLAADRVERVYVAVGSGTITDIVRFASHRTRTTFISVPTAPSVDGFTSVGAPLVIGRWKQTVPAHPPIAVFGDEDTLRRAPRRLIASGFGDMLGKYTSIADWKLGHLIWDEPYDQAIAERAQRALADCMAHAGAIGRGEPDGICSQMDGLVETGLCMVVAGSSRPAGGSEHHVSHFLEMKLLAENRPPVLHGAKVGVACTLMAERYARVRRLSREQAARHLESLPLPDREAQAAEIRSAFGPLAEQSLIEQAPYLDMDEATFVALKQRVVDRWDEIQAVAAEVPAPEKLVGLLREVGAPADMASLGLGDEEVASALRYAHWLRNRFTILKLERLLNL